MDGVEIFLLLFVNFLITLGIYVNSKDSICKIKYQWVRAILVIISITPIINLTVVILIGIFYMFRGIWRDIAKVVLKGDPGERHDHYGY